MIIDSVYFDNKTLTRIYIFIFLFGNIVLKFGYLTNLGWGWTKCDESTQNVPKYK